MSEERARRQMVCDQLEARGITDRRVLDVMGRIPRHLFLPEPLQPAAYEDRAQPIGIQQTISQPLMVGLMTQLLQLSGSESVLEIGTGSGYQAAILSALAERVISIERHAVLAERSRDLLAWLGCTNVDVRVTDGSLGWAAGAPYDRILVTAAARAIPESLIKQLAVSGRMVMPVGEAELQMLTLVSRDSDGKVHHETHGECVFVPLVGEEGWPE